MRSHNDKMSAGNSHAACRTEYKKRMRLDEDNCNNVPKQIKLNAEWQCEYKETHKNVSAENMRNYRKCKVQENKTQASTSTDLTPTAITYNYDQANEYFQKNVIGNPSGYACNICDRLWQCGPTRGPRAACGHSVLSVLKS
jgi:hypothetical protein